MRPILPCLLLAAACKPLPEAEPDFSESLVQLFREVHTDVDDLQIAATMRTVEKHIYTYLAVEGSDLAARSAGPRSLTEDDVAMLTPRPDGVAPEDTLPVATGGVSSFPVDAHALIPLLADQRPVEPQSPDHYDREFLEGDDCWADRACTILRTHQELTKKYPLPPLSITYEFFKPFRWVDLNAGLEGAEGERWAIVASSWNPDTYRAEKQENRVIWQSYTVELWIPRDGGGFTWADAPEGLEPQVEDAVDSNGDGGTLRLLSLWTQADVADVSENIEVGTIRYGTDQNFGAQDEWIEENWTP